VRVALGISAGHLIQLNPYEAQNLRFMIENDLDQLNEAQQARVAAFIEGLKAGS
jgi:hypothetical protein